MRISRAPSPRRAVDSSPRASCSATGAWAGRLPGLPRRIPVRPVRGQLLRLAQSPVRHVTYGAGGYLVPRGDTVLIGATSEEAGFENETSLGGLSAAARHRHARDPRARQCPGGGPLGRAAPDVARHAPDPGSRSRSLPRWCMRAATRGTASSSRPGRRPSSPTSWWATPPPSWLRSGSIGRPDPRGRLTRLASLETPGAMLRGRSAKPRIRRRNRCRAERCMC